MATATRVFLADDNDDMRTIIRIALERDGCEVVEARDGAELLQLLGKAAPGRSPVIVTDVRMPNFSGLAVLRMLRQARSSIPVILLTAYPTAAVHSDAAQWGATAVFRKPFDVEDLRTVVVNAYQLGDVD